MLTLIPGPLRGLIALAGYTLNTIFWCFFLFIVALLKAIVPHGGWRRQCSRILNWLATRWIAVNNLNLRVMNAIRWDIRGLEALRAGNWYLVLSNHQSWVDILALQTTLNQKVPMLKFFLKKELIWVPFLGLAWWALDFPFMKRYSKKQLAENPRLKGKDLEITKKACEKFKHTPVSIMNFVEGTRFTPKKKSAQNNHFNHLLTPKAGGIAFVLGSMGEYLHKIIDVTIVYPEKIPTFWEYISGKVNKIIIDFEVIPLNDVLIGDYFNDTEHKHQFFNWLNALWQTKDNKITALKAEKS